MKKQNYKKILYLLGLTSMLTLNGCNKDKPSETVNIIDVIDVAEEDEKNMCLEKHIESLDIKTLSDGSKYVTDAAVFYALRERFLNNNYLLNFEELELDYTDYNELLNSSDYLYMYDNEHIRNHMAYYITGLKKLYPNLKLSELLDVSRFYQENSNYTNIRINYRFDDGVDYKFQVNSYFSDSDMIDFDIESETIKFSKYMNCNKLGDSKYNIIEQYSLSSIDKTDLDRISIELILKYTLDKELILDEKYLCEDSKAVLVLNNGEDSLEVNLSEEQFETLSSNLTCAAGEVKTASQFLEENNELLINICGDEYNLFLEKTRSISYTLKKPVE